MAESKESPSVAVERALAILEAVANRADGLTNAEISRKLNIPKSSASYILRTLENNGYLRRDGETAHYRVGVKVLSLSRSALSGLDVRDVAIPFMRDIVDSTRLTCHLAILDGSSAVYVEKVEAPGFLKVDTWVGRRMLVHTTSVGKALAAYLHMPRCRKFWMPLAWKSGLRIALRLRLSILKNWNGSASTAMRWIMKRTAWARGASRRLFLTSRMKLKPAWD